MHCISRDYLALLRMMQSHRIGAYRIFCKQANLGQDLWTAGWEKHHLLSFLSSKVIWDYSATFYNADAHFPTCWDSAPNFLFTLR